jgi:hypothetical protein
MGLHAILHLIILMLEEANAPRTKAGRLVAFLVLECPFGGLLGRADADSIIFLVICSREVINEQSVTIVRLKWKF